MRRRNNERWRAVSARLGRELTIWIATVRPDGRPHLTPVWFVWLDEKLYFATDSESRKFLNLHHNQNVSLALPDTSNVLIIEGEAHGVGRGRTEELADYFYNKYEWDFRYDETRDSRLVEVTPHQILAWGDGFDDDGIRVL